MSRQPIALPGQLAFDALLTDAVTANEARIRDRQYGHLPPTMDEAVPFFRSLLETHHKAMLDGDQNSVMRLRTEAHDLATKLNNYEVGIIANDDAPGCKLAALTRAKDGEVPLWGQSGAFEIRHKTMRVRIEMSGLFGIGATHMSWLGFSAHAVERNKPFLSDTGYRSFLGVGGALCPGYTPDQFATGIIGAFVAQELKGKLLKIVPIVRSIKTGPARRSRSKT